MAYEVRPNLNHHYPTKVLCKHCGASFIAMIPDGQNADEYFKEQKENSDDYKRKCPRCDLSNFIGSIDTYSLDIFFFEAPEIEGVD